ncbi:MAG: tetratricopeptide repeat protein [Candidatus Hodarchaeota archaeon]
MKSIDGMTELKVELSQKILKGKQALSEGEFDHAINYFESAVTIAKEFSPSLKSIIGVSYAYMALAFGKKNIQNEALEKITMASELIPSDPKDPMAYASILLGLGVEFQKIGIFDCSIITLKKALKLARSQVEEQDFAAISIIARNLAFSYKKTNNNKSAAKLFRIAGDLEDQSNVSIDLYRNSAYLYYQEKMKEEALNILETAFDKAGILGDKNSQMEIARFQAIISYEIFDEYQETPNLEHALAYAHLCFDKFSFIEDQFWALKIQFDRAMILSRIGNKSEYNEILKKIAQNPATRETEEFIIKAHLLLAIQALEAGIYSDATFYIENITTNQMKQLEIVNPKLTRKINEVKEILQQSLQRGMIQTDLRFSRKELDLPVEEILAESEVVSLTGSSITNDISSLSPPKLEVTVPTTSTVSPKLKPPSVEALQELFEAEEVKPQIIQQEMIRPVTPKREPDIKPEEKEEEKIDYSRLFKAHRLPTEEVISPSSVTTFPMQESFEVMAVPDDSAPQYVEEIPRVNIRSEAGRRLQKAGWTLRLNFTNTARRGAEPDIIAEKGLIRKNRKLIFFAENPTDAEICSFLLQSSLESGEKIIFLLSGNPREVYVPLDIKIITQIDKLFK